VPGAGPGRARAPGQHPEHVVKALGELPDGQDPHPRGRQLDRQRQPVQLLAHPGHRVLVGVGDLEGRGNQPRPVREQLDGVAAVERRHRPGPLPLDAKRLAAGGQDGQRRALGEQVLRQDSGAGR